MTNFQLTPEQELFRDSVRRTLDGFGATKEGTALRSALAELGVMAVDFPEILGGLDGEGVETMLVMSECGRALLTEPLVASAIFAGTLLVATGEGADLTEGLTDGSRLTVVASAEPESGGDQARVAATASRAVGGYVLSGRKSVVIGAPVADTILVTAISGDGSFPGLGLFRVDAPAARIVAYRTLDGYVAGDLNLDGLELAEEALLSVNCRSALLYAIDAAIVATCAEAVGAMEAALWLTNDYLKMRKQFGVAIGSFQALQHRMATAFVAVEQARSILYRALAARNAPQSERRLAVSAAKSLIGRSGKALGADMVQLHGGIGMTEEYKIGHYYRRLMVIEERFGSSDHHLRQIAGC